MIFGPKGNRFWTEGVTRPAWNFKEKYDVLPGLATDISSSNLEISD